MNRTSRELPVVVRLLGAWVGALLAVAGCSSSPGPADGGGVTQETTGDGAGAAELPPTPPTVGDLMVVEPTGNPLSRLVLFSTDLPATWELTVVGQGIPTRRIRPDLAPATTHAVPVVGLRAAAAYTLSLRVEGPGGGIAEVGPLDIETAPLPADFPPVEYVGGEPAAMEPGLTLVNVMWWGDVLNWGLVLALDSEGQVVWYYRANQPLIEAVRSPAGTVLAIIGEYNGVVEIDLLGNLLHWWAPEDLGVDSLHHALSLMPDGNIVSLATELRWITGYPSGQGELGYWVVGDIIVEFTRAGEVVRSWPLLDVLNPYQYNAGFHLPFWAPLYSKAPTLPKDWSHGNAVTYHPEGDFYFVGLANTDQVAAIDRESGALLWALGPDGSYALEAGGEWPSLPHGAELVGGDRVLLYDDGVYKETKRSRLVEYQLSSATPGEGASAAQAWSWDGGQDPFYCFSPADVDRLANGNLLVLHGSLVGNPEKAPLGPGNSLSVRLEELVVEDGEPRSLFTVAIGSPGTPGGGRHTSFAAQRIASLYPDGWFEESL